MKVIETKTYRISIVAPENDEEAKKIQKIIEEVEDDKSKPFNPDEWTLVGPGDS